MMRNFFLLIVLQLVVSCAPHSQVRDKSELLAYVPHTEEQTLLARHLPLFIIENPGKPYNRIGTPAAELTAKGDERVFVSDREATIYVEERKFSTARDSYSNLIYRVHFSKTPYGLFPFQIGAGKNVGLFVIVTLNSTNQPVLYTAVHTCGCYLAFIPTTSLSTDAYPPGWPVIKQVVYSEILPARLDPTFKTDSFPALAVLIRDASHRVQDVWLSDGDLPKSFATNPAATQPLASLDALSLDGGSRTISFYETSGARTGYVKGSHKPLERVLMSWWAFDWKIGEDKKLGVDKNDPPIFFTSLKFWAREQSDMRDFPTFLAYWGWKL